MKRMSFALTKQQLIDGTKTVTRRLGWTKLKAGDELLAVNKVMGFKKGEKSIVWCKIKVIDVRREPLDHIGKYDVANEGFPNMTPGEFVDMFCRHMGCKRDAEVTRIEFKKV